MKNFLTTLTCASLLATAAIADITRVEMGAGAWMQDVKGSASYSDAGADGSYTSSEKDKTQPYVWALVKHPVPLVPNLRLEYVSLEDSGIATGEFKDFDVTGSANMAYDMKQYDIIPYYNILDNTFWVTLDLGLDIKVIDLSYDVTPIGAATIAGDVSGSETIAIPLLYVRARTEIPTTNIGLEADIKYVKAGDSTVYDVRAKLDYTLDFMPVIQPAIELGYRMQKIDIDESDADATVDLEFSGAYVGLMLRF
ncbi:MAG: TIGR04219 family outer membrane beta-barrel protein [Sulfurimonas sp.]|uniref:TIGR04219 family outer membrane beta-barrel protein n=1 Tax=Sulfurimonas sp. TaxID=2022749 RepID=UPI00261D0DC5|nr:TIGR04219 family outer membrane beta-barrel protein [Sulfurimonas sp.]MCW8894613.1 TIGR04219 family outer membrane beta-barrel protein [Sulfurimonas sp.]MCW8955056.1 TIGR04219 family outer membrane beta-barrel protein [Sulfurimonas sp.]MCW9067437.1 TIGR04219 family outer membrane beta-barrel protein [Sulfurimonas sp.]